MTSSLKSQTKCLVGYVPRFQIPNDIPLRMARKREKYYSGQTANICFYKAVFIEKLRLRLKELHCRLANHLGVSVSQIYPNAWRIFLGAKMLWGKISGCCHHLTLDKFFFYYIPHQIVAPKDFYNFVIHKALSKLVTNILNSNHDWKSRYFFIQGSIGCVGLTSGTA